MIQCQKSFLMILYTLFVLKKRLVSKNCINFSFKSTLFGVQLSSDVNHKVIDWCQAIKVAWHSINSIWFVLQAYILADSKGHLKAFSQHVHFRECRNNIIVWKSNLCIYLIILDYKSLSLCWIKLINMQTCGKSTPINNKLEIEIISEHIFANLFKWSHLRWMWLMNLFANESCWPFVQVLVFINILLSLE